jgi:hypothetical protein
LSGFNIQIDQIRDPINIGRLLDFVYGHGFLKNAGKIGSAFSDPSAS